MLNGNQDRFKEAMASIVDVAMEPMKGLSLEAIEMAKQRNKGSFLEDWFGIREEYQVPTKVIVGLTMVGIAGVTLYKYRRMIRFK